MVKVEKDYVFEGPDGELRLRRHVRGQPTALHPPLHVDRRRRPGLPELHDRRRSHVHGEGPGTAERKGRDVRCVSRAPYASIARYRDEHGWTFPWYSSRDSDFTYDYHVTLDPARAPIEYNYKSLDELHADGLDDDDLRGDWPGASVFLRRGDEVFHTYSAYARGLDHSAPAIRSSISRRTAGRRAGRTRPRAGRRALTRSVCRWTAVTVAITREPKAGPVPAGMAASCADAGVAEWLGTGLQSRLHGFESRHSLRCSKRNAWSP